MLCPLLERLEDVTANVNVLSFRLIPVLLNGMHYSEIDIVLLKVCVRVWCVRGVCVCVFVCNGVVPPCTG